MKIIYNDYLNRELVDFLLSQEEINDVKISEENQMDCINIRSKLAPNVVAKYIDLYQKPKWSTMFAFDKQNNTNIKEYRYIVKNICCEYCHMHFIRELFENDDIIKVDSNFSLDNPAFNIEYKIYFNDTYSEKELLEYINKSL